MFEDRTQIIVNQDLLFRTNRLECLDEIIYSDNYSHYWQPNDVYEVMYDTSCATFYENCVGYNDSLVQFFKSDNILFHKADKLLCVNERSLHSINGMNDVYLDVNLNHSQLAMFVNSTPDTMFGYVVKLNELEYIDYLYGRD